MHPIFYMLEKELIQHKIVIRLPLFVLIFTVLMSLFLIFGFNADIEFSISGIGNSEMQGIQQGVVTIINFGVMLVSFLLSTLYLSKAICNDRQEGSIAFWRSMPISDLVTQLIKLAFALIIIPIICSLLVLSADLFLWLVSLFSPDHVKFIIGDISLMNVLKHYVNFLAHMFIISIALLPFACMVFAASQLSSSPMLMALIAIYALKIACGLILPDSGLDYFFYQFINLPTALLLTSEPKLIISNLPVLSTMAMYVVGGIFFAVNLSIQKYGELRVKHLF